MKTVGKKCHLLVDYLFITKLDKVINVVEISSQRLCKTEVGKIITFIEFSFHDESEWIQKRNDKCRIHITRD